MSIRRLHMFAVTAAIVSLSTFAPASAWAAPAGRQQTKLVGELGYEGGAYPGGFHRTSGSVLVAFPPVEPLIIDQKVGKSGRFEIALGPGTYTVTGCGPSDSAGDSTCGKPRQITLAAGEVKHVRLVWVDAP